MFFDQALRDHPPQPVKFLGAVGGLTEHHDPCLTHARKPSRKFGGLIHGMGQLSEFLDQVRFHMGTFLQKPFAGEFDHLV